MLFHSLGFDKCMGWCSYHSCIKQNIDRFTALKIPQCFVCLAREEPEGRVSGVQVSGPESREAPTRLSAERGQHRGGTAPTREGGDWQKDSFAIPLGCGSRPLHPTQPQSSKDLETRRGIERSPRRTQTEVSLFAGFRVYLQNNQAPHLCWRQWCNVTRQWWNVLTRPLLCSKVKNAI